MGTAQVEDGPAQAGQLSNEQIYTPWRTTMKRLIFLLSLILCVSSLANAQRKTPRAVKYGSNSTAGKTFVHDGIRFYYEVYGCEPQSK